MAYDPNYDPRLDAIRQRNTQREKLRSGIYRDHPILGRLGATPKPGLSSIDRDRVESEIAALDAAPLPEIPLTPGRPSIEDEAARLAMAPEAPPAPRVPSDAPSGPPRLRPTPLRPESIEDAVGHEMMYDDAITKGYSPSAPTPLRPDFDPPDPAPAPQPAPRIIRAVKGEDGKTIYTNNDALPGGEVVMRNGESVGGDIGAPGRGGFVQPDMASIPFDQLPPSIQEKRLPRNPSEGVSDEMSLEFARRSMEDPLWRERGVAGLRREVASDDREAIMADMGDEFRAIDAAAAEASRRIEENPRLTPEQKREYLADIETRRTDQKREYQQSLGFATGRTPGQLYQQ